MAISFARGGAHCIHRRRQGDFVAECGLGWLGCSSFISRTVTPLGKRSDGD